MKIQQKKKNKSTGMNVHPHFPFLVEDIQLFNPVLTFTFLSFPTNFVDTFPTSRLLGEKRTDL